MKFDFPRFSNVSELDRLLEGFVFMAKHLPWTDFVRPISESAMAVGYQCADSRSKMFATFADSPSSKRVPVKFPLLESVRTKADGIIGQDETENTIKFPVMIVLVGSAYGCFKVIKIFTFLITRPDPLCQSALVKRTLYFL